MSGKDYVFIGSSMVARGVHQDRLSELLGVDALNMGLAGATPSVVEPWSVDHVLPATGTSHVVWGLSTVEFSASFHEGVGDRYANQLAGRTDWVAGPSRYAFERSSLYRLRNHLRTPAWILGEIRNGTNPRMRSVPMYLQHVDHNPDRINEREPYVTGFELNRNEFERFERLARTIAASGRQLTVVFMPVTEGFVEAHPGSTFENFRTALETSVDELEQYGDIRFLDLHDSLADEHFADGNHLSSDGALVFAASLADSL